MMKNRFQRSLPALGVLLLSLGCASGDVTDLTAGAPAADGQGTTVASEEDDGTSPVDIEALLRENEEQIAKLDAQWRSPYTPEETRRLLAEMGLQDRTYDELIAESKAKQTQALSPEERNLLSRHFAELSPEEALGFSGRIITVGDMLVDADALLEVLSDPEQVVDKGFGCLTAVGGSVGCASLTSTYMRDDGDGSPDTVDFNRPDVQRTTFVIVENAAPAFFFNALVEITARIEELNTAGDCLVANTFVPIRQSDFDARDAFTKAAAFKMPVIYGQDPCPLNGQPDPLTRACSFLPSGQTVMLMPPGPNSGGVTQGRLAFGKELRVNSRFFASDTAPFRGSVFHELGHLMGRAHNVANAGSHKIPGTSVVSTVASVMDVSVTANRANALSGDDLQVLKTLYSDNPNRSNDGCGYVSGFRNFGAIAFNGCPADSIPSGSQTICCGPLCGTCGGAGCSSRPGGTDACCEGRIESNAVSCSGRLSGPCLMP